MRVCLGTPEGEGRVFTGRRPAAADTAQTPLLSALSVLRCPVLSSGRPKGLEDEDYAASIATLNRIAHSQAIPEGFSSLEDAGFFKEHFMPDLVDMLSFSLGD